MDKRTAIIAVAVLVILALLLRKRRQITIVQQQELNFDMPGLNNYDIQIPGLGNVTFPDFKNPFGNNNTNQNFDWMNTTNIACGCAVRTVKPYFPQINIGVTNIDYVSRLPDFGNYSLPVFVGTKRDLITAANGSVAPNSDQGFGVMGGFGNSGSNFIPTRRKTREEEEEEQKQKQAAANASNASAPNRNNQRQTQIDPRNAQRLATQAKINALRNSGNLNTSSLRNLLRGK